MVGQEGGVPAVTERQLLDSTAAPVEGWDRGGGRTVEEVARSPHLTNGTVRNHLSIAIQTLIARNRLEAARIAEAKGWL